MRGTCDAPGLLNKSRRNVNKLVGSFLRQLGMSFLTHKNICHSMALYRKDGVHLKKTFYDILESVLGDRPACQVRGSLNSATAMLEAMMDDSGQSFAASGRSSHYVK